jgi:hypothetical protein
VLNFKRFTPGLGGICLVNLQSEFLKICVKFGFKGDLLSLFVK